MCQVAYRVDTAPKKSEALANGPCLVTELLALGAELEVTHGEGARSLIDAAIANIALANSLEERSTDEISVAYEEAVLGVLERHCFKRAFSPKPKVEERA